MTFLKPDPTEFKGAAKLLAEIEACPHLWHMDSQLKYIKIGMDTRNGRAVLSDRDGNRIHPDRVRRAILAWNERFTAR